MTTALWIVLDTVVAVLTVVAWFATGVAAARGRARPVLLVAAVVVTVSRVATVAVLAGRGWWFVQEKVLLGLPMLLVTGLVAVLLTRSAHAVVALLTAAYAALAGLAVTFVAGYPLTWNTAMVTVGLVGLAALLTARAVAAPADRSAPGAGISRRRFVSLAGGAVVASAAGVGRSFLRPDRVTAGEGVPLTEFRGAATPMPGAVVRRHVLTARTATVRLPSGREVEAWTYDGEVPGPAITATQGDLIEVRLRNDDIEGGVTLHWHGYDVPCGEDGAPGVTQHAVVSGQDFTYRFRADQVGTYWYHTHFASHVGVRKGLYGTLVVRPRDVPAGQVELTLPVHTFDGTVVLAGRDGRTDHTVPAGTPVRLRLVNTDSDPHRFALAGTPFRVAAVDGRDLHEPGEVSGVGLRLTAGGRYDLVFTMPDTAVALLLDADPDGGVLLRPHEDARLAEQSTSDWPELDLLGYGTPAPVPFGVDDADRHFTLVLDRGLAIVDGGPTYAHTVNGLGHPSIPDQVVAEGEIVAMTVVNRSLVTHPWHLHGHPVLVVFRDGAAPTGSPLWMDSVDVRPGEVWQVCFRATNPGIWMNHCHNLPHAEQGMMLRLRYDGVRTPFDRSH